MTKPKTGATAPAEEQQPDVVTTAAPVGQQPTQGGSYIRNADGSLTREEEA